MYDIIETMYKYTGNEEALNRFLKSSADVGNPDDCWEWNKAIDKKLGYGRSSFLGKPTLAAHRVAYILAYGDYPKIVDGNRTCIRHLCNNRLCVNPRHLALGTYIDNGQDRSRTEKAMKMTGDKILIAFRLRKEGKTNREIAKLLDVSAVCIGVNLSGKTVLGREILKTQKFQSS